MKWGVRSMVGYVLILVIAFFVSVYYVHEVVSNSNFATIFLDES